MNNSQALYDLIMTFLEQNPNTSLVEVLGIFEIIKIQQHDKVADELNQDEIEG